VGHAYVKNLSEFFVRRLYANGRLSIKECVKGLQDKGEYLHASEGRCDEDYMLALGLEDVVRYLLTYRECKIGTNGSKLNPVIEPCALTDEQERVYNDWMDPNADTGKWDCGNDGMGGEYGVLDSIEFKFRKGWRQRYKEVELLEHVTH
jgi:hypothetical protein